MTTLLHRLRGYRPFTAIVVGDLMLDEQLFGAAERLSPDAPVPVLHLSHEEKHPGGAANVAACLRALEANVAVLGVIGDDDAGRAITASLAEDGCSVDGLIVDGARPTTTKRSIVGLAQHRHPQKMFRVDVESRDDISDEVMERLLARFDEALPEADVVCLEDYDKGVCSPALCAALIERCRKSGTPLLVDPAAIADYGRYRGATAITPNRSEAEKATGLATPIDATEIHNNELASRLLTDLDLDAVVLTLDKHGALLETRDGERVHVPTVARSVYDVTGAGDMVLAALAAAVANKFPWLDAVRLANVAAGLEVEEFGAHPIPYPRIQRAVLELDRPLEGKVRTPEELAIELAVHRTSGERIIFTNGCFDVLHAGHVGYLREARGLGDVLVVGVNDDEQVRTQKGEGRPVYPLADRLAVLGELQCVDYLVAFPEPTAERLLRDVHPDVYVKGGDYAPHEINEKAVVDELGIELQLLAHRPGLGSTGVIAQLRSLDDK